MLKALRLGDLLSRLETRSDALVLAGGAMFFICISAVALVGFHDRDLSIRGSVPSVSATSGTTPHSNP